MDAGAFGSDERLGGYFDVFFNGPAEAANGGVFYGAGHLLHRLKIAGAGNGKTCLDDVHAEGFEGVRDFNFLRGVEFTTGHLLSVAEGSVENVNGYGHDLAVVCLRMSGQR